MTIRSKWSAVHLVTGLVQHVAFRSLESDANPHEDIFYETEGQMTGRMVSWGPQICGGQRSRPARRVGEEGGGGGLFSIPSCGGLWTCVCVCLSEEGGSGELREEGSQNTRTVSGCPCAGTSQVEIGIGPRRGRGQKVPPVEVGRHLASTRVRGCTGFTVVSKLLSRAYTMSH